MALQNNLRVQVDKPVWEWARFAPAVSSSLSCSCAADNSSYNVVSGRYVYYLIAAAQFWRYDTWTDTYQQLTSPQITLTTASSMRFMGSLGYRSRVISAPTNNQLQVAGYNGKTLVGFDIKITSGTGIGQRRVITSAADPVIADTGTPTAVSATTITDSTKTWTINQWVGYQIRITHGTGIGQVRKILRNDATSITFIDVAKYAEELDCNAPLVTALSVAAGSQSLYAIESHVLTMDTNWVVNPDSTSKFVVTSGSIMLMTLLGSAPFYVMQQYDITTDTWYIRNCSSGLLPSAASDIEIERLGENTTVFQKGIVTSSTSTTLVDSSANFLSGSPSLIGRFARIYSGNYSKYIFIAFYLLFSNKKSIDFPVLTSTSKATL